MDAETVHRRRWAILGVMSMSLIIVMLNNVTLNVALPELSKDLKADNTELQWILDAYALVFGGLLLVMGCLLYTSPSPRDAHESRMPSSA